MAATQRKAALAVIDLQNDFCPPSGALAVTGGREIAPAINKLLALPFALKLATRDYHPADHISFASQHAGAQPYTSQHTIASPANAEEKQTTALWPDHCVQSTPGAELISELDASKLELVLDKGQDKRVESYSAFGPPFRNPQVSMSGLDEILRQRGITDLFVVGLALDYCVLHTAIDAAKQGFNTYVIEDATKAVFQDDKAIDAARKQMRDASVQIIDLNSKELDMVKAG